MEWSKQERYLIGSSRALIILSVLLFVVQMLLGLFHLILVLPLIVVICSCVIVETTHRYKRKMVANRPPGDCGGDGRKSGGLTPPGESKSIDSAESFGTQPGGVSPPLLRSPLPNGWCFEFNNPLYPDCDDTAMALMVLAGRFDPVGTGQLPPDLRVTTVEHADSLDEAKQSALEMADTSAAMASGLRWLLGMQNKDGG